jgi:hypothetical protein
MILKKGMMSDSSSAERPLSAARILISVTMPTTAKTSALAAKSTATFSLKSFRAAASRSPAICAGQREQRPSWRP